MDSVMTLFDGDIESRYLRHNVLELKTSAKCGSWRSSSNILAEPVVDYIPYGRVEKVKVSIQDQEIKGKLTLRYSTPTFLSVFTLFLPCTA